MVRIPCPSGSVKEPIIKIIITAFIRDAKFLSSNMSQIIHNKLQYECFTWIGSQKLDYVRYKNLFINYIRYIMLSISKNLLTHYNCK